MRRQQSIYPKPAGFTLLEVIFALAIFVAAAALLSRLLLLGVENSQYSQWVEETSLVAENRFAELTAGIRPFTDGGPETDETYPDWQWTIRAEPTDLDYLYLVTIRVANVTDGPAQQFSVEYQQQMFDRVSYESDLADSAETAP